MAVLVIAGVATFGVWAVMEWGLPAANQRFRELMFAQLGDGAVINLDPGHERAGTVAPVAAHRCGGHPALAAPVGAVLRDRSAGRFSRSASPHACAASARRRRISIVASIAYIFTMVGLDEALREAMFRAIAAWLPNILFMLAGALMLRYRREDRGDGVYTRA